MNLNPTLLKEDSLESLKHVETSRKISLFEIFFENKFKKSKIRKSIKKHFNSKNEPKLILETFIELSPFTENIPVLNLRADRTNTKMTLSSILGPLLLRISAGEVQKGAFKKSMRGEIYPSKVTMQFMIKHLKIKKYKFISLVLSKYSKRRRSLIKLLKKSKLRFFFIQDMSSKPFGGCRKKHKPRK